MKHNQPLLKRIGQFDVWAVISAAAIMHLVIFDALILAAPESVQVMYTPDDGYYYLTLARNFIHYQQWTFDGGTSLTSGFHLLQAYLLAGIYAWLHPSPQAFVRIALGAGEAVSAAAALLAWWVGWTRKDVFYLMALTLIISAESFLVNSVSITEWPLVVMASGLYWLVLYLPVAQTRRRLLLFGLGALGSLARSDFGLLPLAVWVASLVIGRRQPQKTFTRAAFFGLVGSIMGTGLVMLHTLLSTGTLVQSSALMKNYWARFGNQALYSVLSLNLNTLGMDLGFADFNRSVFLLGVLLLSGPILLIALIKKSGKNNLPLPDLRLSPHQPAHQQIMVLAAGLCLLGYSAFYAYNGALQNWYTANLVWPMLILVVACAHYINARFIPEARFAILWFSFFLGTTLAILPFNLYPLGEARAPWPHHKTLLAASQYLNENPVNGKVGAWNAGILGYYLGGAAIINIDGLVNNDIYPYAVSNRLPVYLSERNIQYILDFENMFAPSFAARGGYDDTDFLARLKPIQTFDKGQFTEFKFLRLYEIEP